MQSDRQTHLEQIKKGDILSFQQECKRIFNPNLSERDRLASFAMGLSGEAGEVTDLIKKHLYHGHPLNLEKLNKELGDTQWYWSAIAFVTGLPIGNILYSNVMKLEERYPNGFTVEESINRRDLN